MSGYFDFLPTQLAANALCLSQDRHSDASWLDSCKRKKRASTPVDDENLFGFEGMLCLLITKMEWLLSVLLVVDCS